ncbi:MAG: response regulator transcription factor [Mameliella sp.]|nr:response regulator transcription factor [Phaeodactylibacter sp.]
MHPLYRIIIFDDHPIIHEGLKQLLEGEATLTIQSCAATLEELEQALTRTADLLILDLNIKGKSSLKWVEHIRLRQPEIKILAFSSYNTPDMVRRAFNKGVNGYLLKDTTKAELLQAIDTLLRGELHLSPRIQVPGQSQDPIFKDTFTRFSNLTSREQEIAKAILRGLSSQEIADRLFISLHTVQTHRKNLFRKLGVHSAAELIRLLHDTVDTGNKNRKQLPPESAG